MNLKERIYFIIKGKVSGKVVDVVIDIKVYFWFYYGYDNQVWFWDGNCIRFK